jgi:glycosyltransferase involved in cell wall biosynthesis
MRLKVLVFIVAYNAEKTIINVLKRIPRSLGQVYDTSILIIDDSSKDNTAIIAEQFLQKNNWCKYEVLKNPLNQGYGGNQKLGYQYAMDKNFDIVVLLHGDGQYAPEQIPKLLRPFGNKKSPDAVFGSRMINSKDALKGGMPYYKWIGNKILTFTQNLLLSSNLSEFHSGYRLYKVSTLKKLPLNLNTNDFHFDTEIIVQLFSYGAKVTEISIPTHYGDEICHVNGFKYAFDVLKTSLKARIIKMGIFYDPKFAFEKQFVASSINPFRYQSIYFSTLRQIRSKEKIICFDTSNRFLFNKIARQKNSTIYYIDTEANNFNKLVTIALEKKIDTILLSDKIGKMKDSEYFLQKLRYLLNGYQDINIILSSGNVTFYITRIMMLLGQFNYSKNGILSTNQARLFTTNTFSKFLAYNGYIVKEIHRIPGPYPLALGINNFSKLLVAINNFLILIFPGLFTYQALFIANVKPQESTLLAQAKLFKKK